jgi:hypothetical protein
VLDLGAACEASLTVYGLIARQVRFADLSETTSAQHWDFPLQEAKRASVDPYDVILLWDSLGRLPNEERGRMVARLAELAAPTARLHMVLEAPERTGPRPRRFSVADAGHMRHEVSWDDAADAPRLLPADVEKMLAPFHVVRAFTLKDGLREYLLMRRPPSEGNNTPPPGRAGEFFPSSSWRAAPRLSDDELERRLRTGRRKPPNPRENS